MPEQSRWTVHLRELISPKGKAPQQPHQEQRWQVQEKRREVSTTFKGIFPSHCNPRTPRSSRAAARQSDTSYAQMNMLQHAQETAPQDAWAAGNSSYFTPQDRNQHRANFNMIRTPSSSSSSSTSPPEDPMVYLTSNMYADVHRAQHIPSLRRFLRIQDHPIGQSRTYRS
jgi:hypothetical protein